jgi:BlaI family penicillinase repressor
VTVHSKPKKTDLPDLSPSQLEIMQEIWERGETTVSEVWESLLSQRQVARNTILTLMDRLTQKGWLKRRIDAGVHYYSATTARKKTLGNMVNQLIEKAFAGSSEDLVLTLLESRGLTKAESDRIQTLIQQAAKKGNKK